MLGVVPAAEATNTTVTATATSAMPNARIDARWTKSGYMLFFQIEGLGGRQSPAADRMGESSLTCGS